MATDVTKITETISWTDITEGCKIEASGNSKLFNTGDWPEGALLFYKYQAVFFQRF